MRHKVLGHEREEISRSLIGEAQRTGRAVVWDRLEEERASQSMRELGIMVGMAAPLSLLEELGTLYVDFRHFKKQVGPLHREFFESVALLLGGVLQQDQRLRQTRAQLHEAQAHQPKPGPAPTLDELLRPKSMSGLAEEVAAWEVAFPGVGVTLL